MKIAIIMLHYGLLATTRIAISSLAKKIGSHRLILVNNTSSDITSLTKIIPGTSVIDNHKNLGFSRGVNLGIELALRDKSITHVFLLNNDLTLTSGSFDQLLLTFSRFPRSGIVTPSIHHDGVFDWGGQYNKWSGMVKHKNWPNKPKTVQLVTHVAGAAMLISRSLIEQVGTFDERFFLYFEDLDFCLRAARAGLTIHINPDVIVEHQGSLSSELSTRLKYQWSSHRKFVAKHLFRLTYPTAYLYDLIIYPLWYLRSLLNGN